MELLEFSKKRIWKKEKKKFCNRIIFHVFPSKVGIRTRLLLLNLALNPIEECFPVHNGVEFLFDVASNFILLWFDVNFNFLCLWNCDSVRIKMQLLNILTLLHLIMGSHYHFKGTNTGNVIAVLDELLNLEKIGNR